VFSLSAIFLQVFPNGDYYLPIIVGAVTAAVLAFAYAQLVATFPRSGGEYIYASRVFTPVVGAAAGGALLIALTLAGSLNVVSTDQIYVQFMFMTLGHGLGIHALVTFGASTLAHKAAWIVIGLLIVAFAVAVCLRPIHAATRWVFGAFALGLLASLLMTVILLLETRSGFIHAFNVASGNPHAYQDIIAKARATGFKTGVHFSSEIALLPLGGLLFVGFTYANYAAGEIKRPARTYKIAVLASLGIGAAGLFLGWLSMRHAAGINFLQSSASLSVNHPTIYNHLTSVPQDEGGLAYAIIAAGDPVTSVIIGVGTVAAWVCTTLAFCLLSTRVVFALSFDRLLPTKMADVHEKTHAPIYAVGLVGLILATWVVLGNSTTLLTLFRNVILVDFALFVIGSICVTALPYRRPELFAASPKMFSGKLLGIPVVTLVGAASTALFVALGVDVGSRTAYSGGYSSGSIITLCVVAFFGIILYAVSRFNLSRRGIDIRLAMHELPPE
jgi:amino acid transporter